MPEHAMIAELAKARPQQVFPVIASVTKHPQDQVATSWKHHAFPVALSNDILYVLAEEERWVARIQQREPRTREQLATFIDTSVLKEAQK